MKQIVARVRLIIAIINIFLENKYTTVYYKIIDQAKSRNLLTYFESHHIFPKSLGGENTKQNLIKLTAREHFICHMLLTKMVTGVARNKMLFAFHCLVNCRNPYMLKLKNTSRTFEFARKVNSLAMKSRIISDSTKMKMADAGKKRGIHKNCILAAKKYWETHNISNETRKKMAKSLKNRIFSLEHRKKLSDAMKGVSRPQYVKDAISKTSKGRIPWNKGKAMSKEQKFKLSTNKLKNAIQYAVYDKYYTYLGDFTIVSFCKKYDQKYHNAYGSIIKKQKYLNWIFIVKDTI